MDKSIVADAVESAFVLSGQVLENIAVAAEMCADATYDFSKGCDLVAAELGALNSAGLLTFASWEAVRVAFERVAAVRAKDNGAADPVGAGNDCWIRVVKRNKDIHGLTKPKAESPDADRMREKRAVEKAELMAAYAGQSSADLKAQQVEHYKAATPESIASAKALEKAIKTVEKAEKDATKAQFDALASTFSGLAKDVLKRARENNDLAMLENGIVALKGL